MRYLIVDTHELANPRLGQFGRVLTEEEALAKFKEVWTDGLDAGFSDGFNGFIEPKNSEQWWKEMEKELRGTTGELTVSKS